MIIDFSNRVLRRVYEGVGVDDIDFSDITSATRTGPAAWLPDGRLEIPLSEEPDTEEQRRIVVRLTTATQVEENLILEVQAGVAARRLQTGDVAAQVEALSRQVDILVRLVLRDFTEEP